jgi:hypothetical protein
VTGVRTKVLLAILLVIASAGTALGVRALTKADPTPEQIQAAFLACSPSFSQQKPDVSLEERDCMADVMFGFFQAGHGEGLWEAIRLVEKDAPYFYFPCHHVLHRVGERAYAMYGDMAKLILSNNSDVCGTAFIMGGLDAFGEDKPSIEEFERVAQACEAMHGPGYAVRLRGMCEHSTGHVAWKANKEVEKAAEYCARLASEAGQWSCGDGVVMQIYQPANGEATIPLEQAYTMTEELCTKWPEIENTRLGCYSGAGYIYARELYAYDLIVRKESKVQGELTPEFREGLRTRAIFVAERCRAHSWEPGVDKCLRRAAWAIPGTVFWDRTLLEEVCSLYGPHKDNCLVSEEPF